MNTEQLEMKVMGIPAIVQIIHYSAHKGARGDYGMQMEPDEEAHVEIDCVYDRKGYKANWLADKLDKADGWEELLEDVYSELEKIYGE